MVNVFVDGQEGTTGLQILDRLAGRLDVKVITIDNDKRKDVKAKTELLNAADIVFLCVPDDVAKQSVSLITNPDVKVIDASTAHRTNPDWVYGFAELTATQAEKIANSKRVANPGCYACGFASLVVPMINSGLLPTDYPVTSFAISGYSGGGKAMIADYDRADTPHKSARFYGLTGNHKHLPEMQYIAGLAQKPVFTPIVDNFYKGMVVNVPLYVDRLSKPTTVQQVAEQLACYYQGQPLIKVVQNHQDPVTFLDTDSLAGKDSMQIFVHGNEHQIILSSRFDNLGKGASGSAIQCMNLMLGTDPTRGLLIAD